MSNKLFKVWCEYDLGLEDKVFKSEDAALAAGKKAARDCCLSAKEIEELIEKNLLYAQELDFIQE